MDNICSHRQLKLKWYRSPEGYIAGVCEGLGRSFHLNPNLLRVAWLAISFLWGTGVILYLFLAIALPRLDRSSQISDKKILGVCQRLSARWGMELAPIRFIALLLLVSTFGLTAICYLGLHFILNNKRRVLF